MKNMLMMIKALTLVLFFVPSVLLAQEEDIPSESKEKREVCITVDDLPGVPENIDIKALKENTEKLLASFCRYKIPAIGFVNEGKLYENGRYINEKAEILKLWLDKGMELGNHTYSHADINSTPLEEYQEDVIKGEETLKRLLKEGNRRPEYFRHPFLHAGKDIETKHSFEGFLSKRGYTVAPVTIDNSEWIFARAYLNAKSRGDYEMMKRVAGAYIPYMEQKFEYFEGQSKELFGRDIKQILLIHANQLNADHFDELAEMMRRRGYRFISLSDALGDSAYSSPDTFAKSAGITWIHRWAITRGVRKDFFKGEPLTPEFVLKEAGVEGE